MMRITRNVVVIAAMTIAGTTVNVALFLGLDGILIAGLFTFLGAFLGAEGTKRYGLVRLMQTALEDVSDASTSTKDGGEDHGRRPRAHP